MFAWRTPPDPDSYCGHAQKKFDCSKSLTPLTGADAHVKDDYFLGTRFLRKANGNEDARVNEYAAHNAANATSSKSVLGYLAMSKLLVGAERDSEHPSATVTRTRMNRGWG